jgi:hypothetical protein
MRTRYLFLLVIAAALLAAAAFFAFSPRAADIGRRTMDVSDPKAVSKIAVAFVQNPYKDDYELTRVAGYIDNLSDDKITSVRLEIQMTDKSGARKELVKYEVNDVAARSRKPFDANAGSLSGSRQARVKIVSLRVVQ